jgi:hypothetical protein
VLATFVKNSGLSAQIVSSIPSPPYTGELGRIHTDSLEQVQRFWANNGLVPSEQPINTLVDTSFITAAQKAAGYPNPPR